MADGVDGVTIEFPPCNVARIGNCVMIQCEDEDNAIIALEAFRWVSEGKTVTITGVHEREG